MRLLLICPSWGRACGIASYTERLRSGLDALGVASDVATNPANIKRHVDDGGYDGILLQHEYSLYYFNLIAILTILERSRIPLVITMHNTDNRGWMGAQHLFLFRTRAKLVVHSKAALDNLLQANPALEASPPTIIPMGSPDPRETLSPPEEARLEMGLPPKAFVVGFFGFAAEHKGIPNLIKALFLLPDVLGFISAATHPVNPLAVDRIYEACGLFRLSPARNEHGNVILSHDRIPDRKLGSYQHAVDVVVLPYVMHGASVSTSMMAHEVLAARRPLVATDVPYFSDLSDGEVLKIPDNQPRTIAEAIATLRDNPSLRESLVARAAAYSEEHSWPKVARCYLDLL